MSVLCECCVSVLCECFMCVVFVWVCFVCVVVYVCFGGELFGECIKIATHNRQL